MIFRSFLALAALLIVSACSTTDSGDAGEIRVQEREGITSGPMDGEALYSERVEYQGPLPGTQEDLVINVGDRVFYGYDRYDLTEEAQQILQLQAQWLMQYPNVNITIEGHCDERGTREYNLALGERRATAAKDYLIALGVPAHRINTLSFGKERPAVIGTGSAVWAQNRRGVTVID